MCSPNGSFTLLSRALVRGITFSVLQTSILVSLHATIYSIAEINLILKPSHDLLAAVFLHGHSRNRRGRGLDDVRGKHTPRAQEIESRLAWSTGLLWSAAICSS